MSLNFAAHDNVIPDDLKFPPGFLEETRAPQVVAGNIAVQVLGTLFFFARVYSRLFLVATWKSEDWALLAVWVSCTISKDDCAITDGFQLLATGY